MIDFNVILSTVIGTVLATAVISGLSFLFKKLKSRIFRQKFYKRYIFYASVACMIYNTYYLFNSSIFPKWFCVLCIVCSIINVSDDFEHYMKTIYNDDETHNTRY